MQTSKKGEINSNTMIVAYFNTLFTCMDRSSKEKIQKETQDINVLLYFLPLNLL